MSQGRRITVKKLAELAGVHHNTLRFYLKKHGVYEQFSSLSDADLDILVKTFKTKKPSSGLTYVIGFLRSHGLQIQKRRVRLALQHVDGLGQTLRNHAAIDRQLIKWGIVIHGIVDSYCHTAGLVVCSQKPVADIDNGAQSKY